MYIPAKALQLDYEMLKQKEEEVFRETGHLRYIDTMDIIEREEFPKNGIRYTQQRCECVHTVEESGEKIFVNFR